jgi:hypothetical protein
VYRHVVGRRSDGQGRHRHDRDFGGRGKLFDIDFATDLAAPSFQETLPDEGYVDMYQVMKAPPRAVRRADAGPPQLAGDQKSGAGTACCISHMRTLPRRK